MTSLTIKSEAVVLRWVTYGLLGISGDSFDRQFGASSEATDMAQHLVTHSIIYKQDAPGIQCRLSQRNPDAHIPMIFPRRESEKVCLTKA